MSNCEMQLISRIVRTGQLSHVIDWGINHLDFRTAEARAVWQYIAGYYSTPETRGSILGPNVFRSVFPMFELVDDQLMTIDALCHEVRKARITAEAKDACIKLTDEIDIDPGLAINVLHGHMQRLLALGVSKDHDVTFTNAMNRITQRYEHIKKNQFAFSKLAWPWDIMNDLTGGIQDEDYIVLFGRPKSMKTWVLNAMLASAFAQEKKAIIYTKEMTPDQIFLRIAACIGKFPYQELRTGKLSPEDEYALAQLAAMVAENLNQSNLICLSGRDAPEGQDTVPWLQSKVEKYKPDAIFIDGMYLLSDVGGNKRTADWLRVTNISRAIRSMVLGTRVPAICTMQATRGAAKHANGNLDEIAYADAVAQDATLALRVINEKQTPTIALVAAGSREFKLHGLRIHGIPATNFDFKEVMTEKDIKRAEEQDVTQDEPEDPENHSKMRKAKSVRTPKNQQNTVDLDAQMRKHEGALANGAVS